MRRGPGPGRAVAAPEGGGAGGLRGQKHGRAGTGRAWRREGAVIKAGEAHSKRSQMESDLVAQTVPDVGSAAQMPSKIDRGA